MSSNKKSFLLHIDSLDILDELTDEEAGMLFKAIHNYQRCEELELTGLVRIAFSPFRNQFNRDNEKYEKLCEKNRLIAVNRHSTKSTTGTSGKASSPVVTKSTDNDSDSDSDNDSDNKTLPADSRFSEFWDLYGKKVDSKKCEAKFKKLSKADIDDLFSKLSDYIKSTPDKQFRKNPITWLNGKCWNDEIQFQLSSTGKPSALHNVSNKTYYEGDL